MTNDLSDPKRALALTNNQYDVWNNIVTLVLPGVAVFYGTIATIWQLGYSAQVVATIGALVVLGKVLLNLSKKAYKESGAGTAGTLVVDTVNPDNETLSLANLKFNPLTLAGKSEVTLKVLNAPGNMDPRLIDNSH